MVYEGDDLDYDGVVLIEREDLDDDFCEDCDEEEDAVTMTDDGRLKYGNKVINDLTPDQRALAKFLCSEDVGYSFKTIDVEEKVYGEPLSSNQRDNLAKLVSRLNKKTKKVEIKKFVKYGRNFIIRIT
jgi:hypothetical protein